MNRSLRDPQLFPANGHFDGDGGNRTHGPFPPSDLEARARTTDPGTSAAAAASVRNISHSQEAILMLFRDFGPMSDVGLEAEYELSRAGRQLPRQSPSGIRTRRKELVERGLLEDSGQRVRLASGRLSIVWRATA